MALWPTQRNREDRDGEGEGVMNKIQGRETSAPHTHNIFVTLLVFHCPMSMLKLVALENMFLAERERGKARGVRGS